MISQTAEYALRVVLHLAARGAHEPTSAVEAAEVLGVPERYLARVLNALSHEGVLTSTRGAHGGFRLAKHPGELTLAAVVAPFDAVGEPPQCLLRRQRCGEGEPCIAHQHWHDVAARVRLFFQETTIADLIGPAALPAAAGGLLGRAEEIHSMTTVVELAALTVNDVIRRYPRSIEVFNRHGIDACCGGAASVGDAAVRDGADVDALLAELQRVIEAAV